jgi:hypothetical protein
MRYEVYTINGLEGTAKSYKKAMTLIQDLPVNTGGKFGILVKRGKFSYPHQGYMGKDGICYQSTMLLYPPNTKCKMWTPEEYLQAAFQ